MEYTLTMTFLTENGEKSNLSISGVRADVTKTEAIALMDAIIANNVLQNKKGTFVSKYSAQLSQRETTKFEI